MVSIGTALALSGAVVALGVPAVSTAIGVGFAGITASGAVAENKENFKNALVLQALPQTQTIYGFITALFIAMGLGLFTGVVKDFTIAQGLMFLASGAVVAVTGLSAISQGMTVSSGIASCAKNPEGLVPNLVFGGQVETPAIFGFIFALIALVVGLGVLG